MNGWDLCSMDLSELTQVLSQLGQPAYRAKQVFSWLLRGVRDPEQMSNLPSELRRELAARSDLTVPRMLRRQASRQDGTVKYLWELRGGSCVESVLMRYHHGNSVCISSQSGCKMGCAFCASTGLSFDRNLTAGELLDQVRCTAEDVGERISNIVLMGIGEPLDNFDQVMRFLHLVNQPEGLGIGMRHISLSTCGIPGGIPRLAEENLQITLSVSLHAPDDETRSQIMPVNRSMGIERLMTDCRAYFQKTGRRISYEYAMIRGVNDSREQAEKLAALLHGQGAHVNLIPLNHVEGSPLIPSDPATVAGFREILEKNHITVTVRRRLGSDISAACGQLRRSKIIPLSQREEGVDA